MKNNKTNGKGKSANASKAVEATEVVESVEQNIEATEVDALEVRGDITETPEVAATEKACAKCGVVKELKYENFSPLEKGGWNGNCKPCQVAESKTWTDKRKDLRDEQAKAKRYRDVYGISVRPPSAKEFVAGQPLMTIPHYVMPDGSKVLEALATPEQVSDGVYVPSRNADEAFAEIKAIRDAQRDERNAAKDAANALEAAQRKAERDEKRVAREAQAKLDAAQAKIDREARKAEKAKEREAKKAIDDAAKAEDKKAKQLLRDAENLEKADKARLEKEQARLDKQAKKDAEALEKSEQARIARENAINEKAQETLNALKKTA